MVKAIRLVVAIGERHVLYLEYPRWLTPVSLLNRTVPGQPYHYDRKLHHTHDIARVVHYDFCGCDPNDPNKKGAGAGAVEPWPKVNPPPVAPFFGAPNKGCVIGPELCKFFAAESLKTLPGVGGTAEGVEPDAPNENGAGAFPASDFEFPVPDTAPKEKRGFVVAGVPDILAGANDIGLALPGSGAFAPPLGTPNSVAELTEVVSFGGPDCTRLSVPALSLGLTSNAAGTTPLMAKLLGLPPPPTPNIEELVSEELVTVCTGGTDELIDVPKLNTFFGGAEAAGGLDGEVLGGLLEIPKLNFGFCESLMPPAGAAGLVPLVVVVVGLGGCGNEKAPRGVAPGPSP